MTIIFSTEGLDNPITRAMDEIERAPACAACGLEMHRSEVRVVRHAVSRVGAPSPPPLVLPTWTCGCCGQRLPRLTA